MLARHLVRLARPLPTRLLTTSPPFTARADAFARPLLARRLSTCTSPVFTIFQGTTGKENVHAVAGMFSQWDGSTRWIETDPKPDSYSLSLEHPAFGTGTADELREAYAGKLAPGAPAHLVSAPGQCTPGGEFTVVEEVLEVGPFDEVTLVKQGYEWITPREERTVTRPAECVFGGWPSTSSRGGALGASTPARMLKGHVAHMWPTRIAADDVRFELCDGEPIDEETSLGHMLRAASSGPADALGVRIGAEFYPIRFDASRHEEGVKFEENLSNARLESAVRYGIVPMLVGLILLNLAIYLLDPDFFNREHNWDLRGGPRR